MGAGQSKWGAWVAAMAAATVLSLSCAAWGDEDGNVSAHGLSIRGEVREMESVEPWKRQLTQEEDRLESCRRHQDAIQTELDATWTNRFQLLNSEIEKHCNAASQKEMETFREQCRNCLADALRQSQEEHEKHVAEWKQCVNGWRFWILLGLCGITAVALVVLCLLAWKRKSAEKAVLYCCELVVLMGVLAMICVGAFHLLSRIVDLGESGSATQAIASAEYNEAVLQAHDQLSRELGRWGALLGVLGTFVGLVLPVGGYLLQIKAVNRTEEKMEASIQKKLADSYRTMKRRLNKRVRTVDAKVETQVAAIWEEFSDMQSFECTKCFQTLCQLHGGGATVSVNETWIWAQWMISLLCLLQSLNRVRRDEVVKRKLHDMISDLKQAQEREEFKAMRNEFKKQRKGGRTWLSGGVDKLRKRCPAEMEGLERLLGECGIVFETNSGPWPE